MPHPQFLRGLEVPNKRSIDSFSRMSDIVDFEITDLELTRFHCIISYLSSYLNTRKYFWEYFSNLNHDLFFRVLIILRKLIYSRRHKSLSTGCNVFMRYILHFISWYDKIEYVDFSNISVIKNHLDDNYVLILISRSFLASFLVKNVSA